MATRNDLDIAMASDADLAAVEKLLAGHHLPLDGLKTPAVCLWVARHGGRIIGSVALEIYRDGALLRSAAVSDEFRGRGVGGELTRVALQAADERRLPAVYLLTTTAQDYFPRFGFQRITRDVVPDGVRSSVEFTSACPASAIVMRRLPAATA